VRYIQYLKDLKKVKMGTYQECKALVMSGEWRFISSKLFNELSKIEPATTKPKRKPRKKTTKK